MPDKLNIKDWDEDDRPRERAMKHGIRSLSTAELLAILIGSGSPEENAVDLMKRVLAEHHQRLSELSRCSISQLCRFHGIGPAKALTIAAACELGRRRKEEDEAGEERPRISGARDAYHYIYPHLCDLPVEECWAIWLNQAGRVIGRTRVGQGGMTATVVEELFNDQAVVEMLAEDPGITKKREETQQAIVYLDEAIEKINYMQASGDLERGEE